MMIMYANDNHGCVPGVVMGGNNVTGHYGHLIRETNRQAFGPLRGVGLMLYRGYTLPVQMLYCPGREVSDTYSFDTNYWPQYINVNTTEANWDNGNWDASSSINWGVIGYLAATTDRAQGGAYDFSNWNRLGRCAPDTPMVMDLFGSNVAGGGRLSGGSTGWMTTNHGKGYNIAAFDGSGFFYQDPQNILDQHTNFKYWDNDNTRPVYDLNGNNMITNNGSQTDLSGHSIEYYGGRAKYTGAYSSGIAWIEHWWLGWDNSKIANNMP